MDFLYNTLNININSENLRFTMSADKRVYQRIIVGLPARCALSKSGGQMIPVTILDIGPEGIGFSLEEDLERGMEVAFYLDLGSGDEVVLCCEIRWVEKEKNTSGFRAGARIFQTEKDNLEKLVRFYCRKLIPVERPNKKVLVVEDELVMANLLEVELKATGYDVVCAHDGEAGFSKYLIEQPDLIILDIMMPKLNGYEVCRKIRRDQNDLKTPIIMLTAKSEDVDRIVGGVIGAQKYITKPFEAEELLKEIAELLQS